VRHLWRHIPCCSSSTANESQNSHVRCCRGTGDLCILPASMGRLCVPSMRRHDRMRLWNLTTATAKTRVQPSWAWKTMPDTCTVLLPWMEQCEGHMYRILPASCGSSHCCSCDMLHRNQLHLARWQSERKVTCFCTFEQACRSTFEFCILLGRLQIVCSDGAIDRIWGSEVRLFQRRMAEYCHCVCSCRKFSSCSMTAAGTERRTPHRLRSTPTK